MVYTGSWIGRRERPVVHSLGLRIVMSSFRAWRSGPRSAWIIHGRAKRHRSFANNLSQSARRGHPDFLGLCRRTLRGEYWMSKKAKVDWLLAQTVIPQQNSHPPLPDNEHWQIYSESYSSRTTPLTPILSGKPLWKQGCRARSKRWLTALKRCCICAVRAPTRPIRCPVLSFLI